MGITVPGGYDGAGADYLSLAAVLEELAYGDAAVATIISGHNCVGCMPILKYGSDDQKERFLRPMARGRMLGAFALTEAHGGSDAGRPKTLARKLGDNYVLNGTKHFVTSGSTADVALVFAATDPALGPKGVSAFIVPTTTPGYIVVRKEDKLGQRASDTCQIALEDVEIPQSFRLGAEGQGYKIALSNLEGGRIGIAAVAVGIAHAALDAAVAYARERVVSGRHIFEYQAVQFRLAHMAAEVECARQMYLHAAALYDAGRPALKEACIAKLLASEMAERVCSDAIQTFGGYGYLSDYPVERYYRDARVTKIYEGTNDIQHLVIARNL
jgi:alkylation response protein AidB-like acyl-CoA dehydrogenase